MKLKICVLVLVLCLPLAQSSSSFATPSHRFWGPMLALPKSVRATFACIMYRESRSTFNHLNLGDNNRYGSSGIFQIEQATWAAHQSAAHVPFRVHVYQASPYQQELVAIQIWKADGFGPWSSDGC